MPASSARTTLVRVAVIVIAGASACRRAPEARRVVRRDPPPMVEAPVEEPAAHPDPRAMIPGHPVGAAGIPPAPDPASGPMVAWELVPIEDGLGRDDAAWLVAVERRIDGSRALVNVGVRGQCTELAPPMLREVFDGGMHMMSALRSVHCERPEPADFSLTRVEGRRWQVLRSGCTRPSRACVRHGASEEVVGRVAIEGELEARVAGPFARREEGAELRAAPDVAPDTVRARWVLEEPVRDATDVAARNLRLQLDGAVLRRVDFGAVTACRAPTAAERAGESFAPGALMALMCETPDEGTVRVSVSRAGDVLRVHARHGDAPRAVITARVGVPGGARVVCVAAPPS